LNGEDSGEWENGQKSRLRSLGAVFGTTLAAIADTGGIQSAADCVVPHAWQILDATTANQDYGVFLKVLPFAADVSGDFLSVG